MREEAFGPDHPDVAAALLILAARYHLGQRHAEAEAHYQRALNIRIEALGGEHPSTIETWEDLGDLWRDAGDLVRARAAYESALAGAADRAAGRRRDELGRHRSMSSSPGPIRSRSRRFPRAGTSPAPHAVSTGGHQRPTRTREQPRPRRDDNVVCTFTNTYTLWELAVPAGTNTTLETTYGGTENATTGDVCLTFTLAAGVDQTFTIDNTFPLGGQRTIGYWKNWNTCSHDGAFEARAAKTGNHLADEFLPQTLGTYEVDTCEEAVAVLNKSPLNAKKAASNAAYNLAAQLLAAKLNIAAGASTCASVTTAIADADALLTAVGFNGTTLPNLTPAQKTLANQLADFLDQYNNGLIC